MKDPSLLESGPDYWLSGIYKWMVPSAGRPAPHNIITGGWAPGPGQEQVPAGDGWGALVQLARPEACGKQSRGQLARVLDDSWRAMQVHFALDKVSEADPLQPGSKPAPLSAEKAAKLKGPERKTEGHCASGSEAGFPAGKWAEYPAYLHATYKDKDGKLVGKGSGRCYASLAPSAHAAWEKDAYRRCAWANKYDAAEATKADAAALAAAKTVETAAKAATAAAATDAACVAAAGYAAPATGGAPKPLGTSADAARLAKCPANVACLAAAKKAGVDAATPPADPKTGKPDASVTDKSKYVPSLAAQQAAQRACPAPAACLAARGATDPKAAAACLATKL